MSGCVRGPIEVIYINQFEAELLFPSRDAVVQWKRSIAPDLLRKVIFDRITDEEDQKPYPVQLKVGLGFQNETTQGKGDFRIQTILQRVDIKVENLPSCVWASTRTRALSPSHPRGRKTTKPQRGSLSRGPTPT